MIFAHFLILEMHKFWKCDQIMRCSLALANVVNELNPVMEVRINSICTTEPTLTDSVASENLLSLVGSCVVTLLFKCATEFIYSIFFTFSGDA